MDFGRTLPVQGMDVAGQTSSDFIEVQVMAATAIAMLPAVTTCLRIAAAEIHLTALRSSRSKAQTSAHVFPGANLTRSEINMLRATKDHFLGLE